MLMAKGRQLLAKDNMLEEWAKNDDQLFSGNSTENRIKKIESMLTSSQTRLARLIASFTAIHRQLSQRVFELEEKSSASDLNKYTTFTDLHEMNVEKTSD